MTLRDALGILRSWSVISPCCTHAKGVTTMVTAHALAPTYGRLGVFWKGCCCLSPMVE